MSHDVELADTHHRPREIFSLNCWQVMKLLVDLTQAFGEIYRVLAIDIVPPVMPLKA